MAKSIQFSRAIIALVAVMVWSMPANSLFAAEAQMSSGEAKSGLSGAIADFQAKLPAIFQEPAVADVGNKPRLRTHVYTSTGYTSNASLGKAQADSAWLMRISPGLTLEMPIGDRLYTQLDYTYSFATIQGRRTSANTNSHNITALARYSLTDATQFGVKENIQWSELPGTIGNMFVLSTTTADITHKFSDILDGYISDTFQWFQDETETDQGLFNQQYVDNGITTGLNYELSDRIRLSPSASWNVRDFSAIEGKDYWQVRYALKGAYALGAQTTLNAHFGHNIRKFSEGSDQYENNLLWGVGIVNNVTRKISVNLDYSHDAIDTFDTGFLNRTSAQATNADNVDRNFRIMTSDRILLGASYQLNEKNRFGLFGDVQFINAKAEDNVVRLHDGNEVTFEFGPSYTYNINEYMSFNINYTFGRRILSEDSGNGNRPNYTFNRAEAGLNFAV